MNLLILAITSALLVCRAYGGMSLVDYNEKIQNNCFPPEDPTEGGLHFVNGQMNPSSQTLESFIALAEKLEVANPNMRLKEELFHFIRNYIYEDVEFDNTGDPSRVKPRGFDPQVLDNLWEPDNNERVKSESISVPYSQEEICAIYFLLSHSIIREAAKEENLFRSAMNDTIYQRRVPSREMPYTKDKNFFPMEIGVVSVKGLREAVALGKVLTGMYVGLRPNKGINVLDYKQNAPEQITTLDTTMDTLYAVTITDVVSMAKWRPEIGAREGLAEDGTWMSVTLESELDTKDYCPMIYKLKENTQAFESYASMRGAVDGFVLGKVVQDIASTSPEAKLSEILRMYYNRGGVTAKTEQATTIWASFCNRERNIAAFEDDLERQLKLYNFLASENLNKFDDAVKRALDYYRSEKGRVLGIATQEERALCNNDFSVEKPENLPMESPLDIIAVIDTSYGLELVRKQQEILGYMSKELDLSYYGSRMTVLWDKKQTAADSAKTGRVTLKPLIEDTSSSACAACLVAQVLPNDMYEAAPEDEVILAIDQLLQEKKDNETKFSGVNGKVVIYFNFKEEAKSSRVDPAEVRESKALRDMLLRHIDVAVFALGRATDLIKKFARNSAPFVMSAVDAPASDVGKDLARRIMRTPGALQYPDCEKATSESAAIYEDYVSRNSIQHWQMPARYFYKSRSLKFTFESVFGSVKVCHNRATVATEAVDKNCKIGTKLVFEDSNPCKGFNEISCSPFYFSVMGINSTDETRSVCTDTTTENKCKTLDQIRFRVSHEGIRCSGCSGLISAPVLMVLGVIILQLLSKRS